MAFFQDAIFLQDTMVGRKMSGNLTASSTREKQAGLTESDPVDSNCTSPALSCQSTNDTSRTLPRDIPLQQPSTCESTFVQKSKRKRRRVGDSMENETENFIAIEKEKVEIEKQKLQLVLRDNKRKEKEENDSDRLFLLSLLPIIKKVPEREKASVKIKFQQTLHEALYSNNDSDIYRPWKL